MVSQGFDLTDADEYNALVNNPQYGCQKCRRLAKNEANLCKPVKISSCQAVVSEAFGAGMMKMKFRSVDELLDAAIIREMEAQELYAKMASEVENSWIRKVLEGLAQSELLHQAKLEAVKAGDITLEKGPVGDLGIDIPEEPEKLSPDMSYPELLAYAIRKENISANLYASMVTLFSEPNLKEVFVELANEEANHKRRLEIEYELIRS